MIRIGSLPLLTLLALNLSVATASGSLLEYTAGHADIRPVYDGQELSLRYRFDTHAVADGVSYASPTLESPNNAYVRVADTTQADPDDFSLLFSFFPSFFQTLGEPTVPFWSLPQDNTPRQPFFGLSTEELVSTDWSTTFEVTLSSIDGPGDFTLYQAGFGPRVMLSTADGVDTFTFFHGHDHYNWVFTEPGVYSLDITFTGTHATDGLKSATDRFYFAVGDTTAAPIPEPGTMTLLASLLGVAVGCRRNR